MSIIKFDQYKSQIKIAIEKKISTGAISDPQGFILVDGFSSLAMQKEVGGAFIIGGPTILGVSVIGKSTGLIHTFALKSLLPYIQI